MSAAHRAPAPRGRTARGRGWQLHLRVPAVRRAATVALGLYLVVLVGVVLLPPPWVLEPQGVGVVPVDLVLSRPDLLGGWEAQRNVLMTVPLGVLLPLAVRRPYEVLVLVCVGTPLVLETAQLLGSLAAGWAWRAFDVDDLLLNTVGGLLGLCLTGLLLLVTGPRPLRPPPARRLVVGVLAGALLLGVLVSTATTPPYEPPVDACAAPPVGTVTALAGGVEASAVAGGALCLRGPGIGEATVLPDAEPGLVAALEEEDGGGLEVGVARPGEPVVDGLGRAVDALPVEGSDLLVWAVAR